MEKISPDQVIEQIVRKDPRYPLDAYHFVRAALDFTVKQHKKDLVRGRPATGPQHVTGKQLLEGIRRYALHEYGPLTLTLLNHWNIRTTEDVGEIVFNMVEMQILNRTETDSREDFKNGYDFNQAFRAPFEPAGPCSPDLQQPPRKFGSPRAS